MQASNTAAPGLVQRHASASRQLLILTILGFGIPIGLYFWFLSHYTLNVVLLDQWDDVSLIAASYHDHLTLSALWAQHTDNRVFFPNLIVLALSRLTAFNVTVEEYLGAAFLLTAAALLIFAHRRRSPTYPWIVYCPVVILMFSIVQAGNTLWGFQLAWYLVLLALAAAIYILDAKTHSVAALLLAITVAVIGSFSSFQGLFIWVVGLMLLYYRRRPTVHLVGWCGAAVLTTALYFYNFNRSKGEPPSSLTALHQPLNAIRFFFETIGDVLGVPLTHGGTGADVVGAFGCLIFALALYALWSGGRTRDTTSAAPIGVVLIVFGLLFALCTTYGRTDNGPVGASQSRYTTYDILIVVGTYLIYLERARHDSRSLGAPNIRATFGALLASVIAVQALFGFVNGIRWARTNDGVLASTAAITAAAGRISDATLQASLNGGLSAQVLRDDIGVLSTHRLTFFSDPASVEGYRHLADLEARFGLFEHEKAPPSVPTSVEMPRSGAVLSGTTILAASAAKSLHPRSVTFVLTGPVIGERTLGVGKYSVYGWALSWSSSTVPSGVYQLYSEVEGASGDVTRSRPVVITVKNNSS